MKIYENFMIFPGLFGHLGVNLTGDISDCICSFDDIFCCHGGGEQNPSKKPISSPGL